MKPILSLLVIFALCSMPLLAKATETETVPEQTVKNNQSYFTANLQKQPQEEKAKQRITNSFTFFTINVQINGKIKEESEK